MTKPVRFQFDTEFGAVKRESEPQVPLAVHSAALAEAEARGHARGVEEANANNIAAAERAIARGLDRVADDLARLAVDLPRLEQRLEGEAIDVAVAVGRKLAASLVAREPLAEIEQLIAGCLAELRTTPHLVVRVADGLLDAVKTRLDRLAAEIGFAGRLVVLGEPEIALGDVRIEWADGGVVRDSRAQAERIDELLRRFLAGRSLQQTEDHRP